MSKQGRPRGVRPKTTPAEYRQPAPLPGSGLIKMGVSVDPDTHRKLWHLAQILDTSMAGALDQLCELINPEAGVLPQELARRAVSGPRQLPLSA